METSTLIAEKSTHVCEVLEFDYAKAKKHENADKLAVMNIGDTDYSYVLNIADWESVGKTKVVWIPPDSLVPVDRPEFNFLAVDAKYDANCVPVKGGIYARVKAKRLRGVVSYGLLVKYSGNLEIGENAANELGVVHYEPIATGGGNKKGSADCAAAPKGDYQKYDVDSFLKWGRKVFVEGEAVYVTMKFHGENYRAVFKDGVQNVGSRQFWKKEFNTPPNITVEELVARGVEQTKAEEIYNAKVVNYKPERCHWWKGFYNTPGLEQLCKENEGYCVYGEIINAQGKGFEYGLKPGEFTVKVFDILSPSGSWLDFAELKEMCAKYGIPMVDIIKENWPLSVEEAIKIAETYTNPLCKVNEGIVIGPMKERWDSKMGRVKAKVINPAYLELK